VRELVPLGLQSLRLTGGEPTLRPRGCRAGGAPEGACAAGGPVAVDERRAASPALAPRARRGGLDRVNVSVDSLRPERIVALARRDLGFAPITALEAATAAGLAPVKVNVVLVRGTNDDEIEALAALTSTGRGTCASSS
jgi:cyclic pyranopterin phosphate synthase